MKTLGSLLLTTAFIGQSASGQVNVAVVNVPVVSERYDKTSDLEAKFEAIRTKLNQQRDELRDRIERLTRSLQQEIKPGTQEFHERRKQLAMLEAELQWFVDSESQRVERGLGESLKEIYTDIHQGVRAVAERRGIDLVLAADQLPEAQPETSTQVRQQILLQKLIYWNPTLDITDNVVAHLNEEYRRKKAAQTPAAPPREPHEARPRPARDRDDDPTKRPNP